MNNRVSNEQLDELLDYLAEHPAMARGVGPGTRSKEAVDKLWNDITIKLNSLGSGSSKSCERWKRYWADIKHKCKARLARWKQDTLGQNNQGDLSEVDRKVLAIIGEQVVFADSLRVPEFNMTLTPKEERIISSGTSEVQMSDASTAATDEEDQETSELQKTYFIEIESPVNRPPVDRRLSRRNRLRQSNTAQSIINPRLVMRLERRRIEAEEKLANAALVVAEASRIQAEAARAQTEMMRMLVELTRRQSEDIRTLVNSSARSQDNFIINAP